MRLLLLLLILALPAFAANTAPTPQIISATMRPGTTFMDVIYRVNDSDDATVRVRALAFVNGNRSFANILRPVTFVEGTAGNLGDAIPTNSNQVLSWNVAADWDIDLGKVTFEILALDSRGLLPFDWITIPAANGQPAFTISKDAPSDAAVLNALFWLYADGDPGLTLNSGVLSGTPQGGIFSGVPLATSSTIKPYATDYVFMRMNLQPASLNELNYSTSNARAGLLNPSGCHPVNKPFEGITVLMAWGDNTYGQLNFPINPTGFISLSGGWGQSLALKNDGTVVGWGNNNSGQITPPAALTGVTAISKGWDHSLALKADGTVVAWGSNGSGQTTIPLGLTGVTQIAAGGFHNLVLKSDGTVVAWGSNSSNASSVPANLNGVIAIAARAYHSLALKSDGTVVAWGSLASVPSNLSGVTAISAGDSHNLALKSDGTVVAWGSNTWGQCNVPAGLTGVTSISAGHSHNLALKSDGTVVAWGKNDFGQASIPEGVSGVVSIAAGVNHNLILKTKAP
jgi:hypothetical protein